MEKEAPLIFVSYAHADDGLRLQFETALSSLTRQGLALAWTDPQITACISDDNALTALNKQINDAATAAKIDSTPTFVINGKTYDGYQDPAAMDKAITEAEAAAK